MEKTKGIVVFQGQDISKIKLTDGTMVIGRVSGKFRQQVTQPSDYPVVGDEVIGVMSDVDQMIIDSFSTRKSFLQRKVAGNRQDEQGIAANVTTVFITTSANEDYNLARLERFTTIVWDSGATPVLVLTKTDLITGEKLRILIEELETYFYGISVCQTNCYTEVNDDLKSYLNEGDIVAFIGSSGVGKSTLLNQLLKENLQVTKEIREDDARGKHTTTSRHLFTLPNGAMVIDTPGMREIGLATVSASAFDHQYQVIYDFAKNCRFSDCQHQSEPGCQVKEAIQSGDLDEMIFKSYLKMERELVFLRAKEEKKQRKAK